MNGLTLLHKDTLKESFFDDKLFIVILIVLGFCLVFLLYKFLKK